MKYENDGIAVRYTVPIPIGNSSFFLMPTCNCQVAEVNYQPAISRWLAIPIPIRADCDRFID